MLTKSQIKNLALGASKLRLKNYRKYPGFVENSKIDGLLQSSFHSAIVSAIDCGVVEKYESKSKLLAIIIFTENKNAGKFEPEIECRIEYNLRSKRAKDWVAVQLCKHRDRFGPTVQLLLDASYSKLIPVLEEVGLYVDLKVTAGSPLLARKRLQRSYDLPKNLAHFGLEVVPLKNKVECKRIVEIFEEEIDENIAYRWFKKNKDEYLKKRYRQFCGALNSTEYKGFLIRQSKNIVGYFGLNTTQADPIFGCKADTEFIFSKSIQGKGIVKWAYAQLLEKMVEEKVSSFIGGTNQKSILHLNRIMGRKPICFILKYGKPILPTKEFL